MQSKLHLHNTNVVIIWRLHKGLSRKKLKAKLMLCKPLFIVHGRVKGSLRVILQYKNEMHPLQKWAWDLYNKIVAINAKLQV